MGLTDVRVVSYTEIMPRPSTSTSARAPYRRTAGDVAQERRERQPDEVPWATEPLTAEELRGLASSAEAFRAGEYLPLHEAKAYVARQRAKTRAQKARAPSRKR